MAADNTITIEFDTDTSGLSAGMDQVNAALSLITDNASNTSSSIDGLFGTMEKASGQILKGVLQGTQTWQQAITRALSGILASYANALIWIPLHWAQAELSMTAATMDGNAERTASNEAASASNIATQSETAIATILSDAKQVFGGVFAFLSSIMGPAAAGPAAAAASSVVSYTSAETGAWNIPSDTPAYLHAGEMVIPKSFASSMRENGGLGGGGGGDAYTINIQAIDTQTGAQFLKNNASTIASTLSSQVRNFNRNVPAWKN